MKSYIVYILCCSDGSYYTGITGNFDNRWTQHQEGYFKSCYTYSRRPLKVKYYLEFEDVIQAILFEKRIKGWSRAKKTALINDDFDTIQLLAECRNASHFKYKPDLSSRAHRLPIYCSVWLGLVYYYCQSERSRRLFFCDDGASTTLSMTL